MSNINTRSPLPMPWMLAVATAMTLPAAGASDTFDASFLQPFAGTEAGPNLDLNAIASSDHLGPGTYPVTLRLNQSFFDRRDILFKAVGRGDQISPCLSPELLREMGVKLDALAPAKQPLGDCVDLEALIEGALSSFDAARLALDVSVPQVALDRDAVGYVAPSEWDSGIDAATLNYQFSGAEGRTRSGSSNQYSLYLRAGVNLAGWRLRSNSVLSQNAQQSREWQRSNTYVQRDLPGTFGTLTLGESFTPGDVFDSLPYRGVQLASDMGMLPDSLQGYAPVIRGIAETQAKVEVLQNGYSLYSTFVPPGSFVIDDLHAAAGSGELEVVITEADGRQRKFTQPYATLSNMLRQGIWRYSATAGQYNGLDGYRPDFAQFTFAYGLPLDFTLYTGVLGADFYRATQLGLGKNLGSIGAMAVDVTQAYTASPGGPDEQGQSYGWRYGKAFATGTSVRFAGYRYSTAGYRDFGEAAWQQQLDGQVVITKRSKLEASIAQPTSFGSFYFNVSQQDYWNSTRRDKQYQLGISSTWRGVSYGLYASRNLSNTYGEDQQVALTLSMPLGSGGHLTYGTTRNNSGDYDHRASYSDRATPDGRLMYGLDASRSPVSGAAGSASLSYLAPFAQLGSSVTVGEGYHQAAVTASGSVLAHQGGIELGHTLGDTLALVEVPGIANVGVLNAPGTLTNARGYSLVPYMTPYRRNRLSLDTSQLENDVDIENGITDVVPRRGAVVKARFVASRSAKMVANLKMTDGTVPPFGSQVMAGEERVGVVGPGGQVLLSLREDMRELVAQWGKGDTQRCRFEVDLSAATGRDEYQVVEIVCTRLEGEQA